MTVGSHCAALTVPMVLGCTWVDGEHAVTHALGGWLLFQHGTARLCTGSLIIPTGTIAFSPTRLRLDRRLQ